MSDSTKRTKRDKLISDFSYLNLDDMGSAYLAISQKFFDSLQEEKEKIKMKLDGYNATQEKIKLNGNIVE